MKQFISLKPFIRYPSKQHGDHQAITQSQLSFGFWRARLFPLFLLSTLTQQASNTTHYIVYF